MQLRLSYSAINLWSQGRYDDLIRALKGIWAEPSPAMEFGKEKHAEWEAEVKRSQCLPSIFGGRPLENPITEKYYCEQLNDWLWVCGVIDLEYGDHGQFLVDYKTGRGSASGYLGSLQAGIYKILRPNAERFTFQCFNQYSGVITSAWEMLTPHVYEKAMDDVMSVGCDVRALLENIGLGDFDNLKPRKKKDETI